MASTISLSDGNSVQNYVLKTPAGVLRTLFRTLLPSDGDIVEAIEFSNLVLGHFHSPNFNFGQREPKLLAFSVKMKNLE